MFETRKDAIAAVAARPALKSGDAVPFDLETYASDVFGIDCMRERLPKGVFQKLYKKYKGCPWSRPPRRACRLTKGELPFPHTLM